MVARYAATKFTVSLEMIKAPIGPELLVERIKGMITSEINSCYSFSIPFNIYVVVCLFKYHVLLLTLLDC